MTRGTCKTCGGPAYVGFAKAECLNAECAPFDPMSCAGIVQVAPPDAVRYSPDGEWWHGCAVIDRNTPERVWAVVAIDRFAYGYIRPTREACFAAWARDHRDFIADQPARLTVRALQKARPEAFKRWAKAKKYDDSCVFFVESWTDLAWEIWEEAQR